MAKMAGTNLRNDYDEDHINQEEDADIRMTESGSLMQNPSVSFHHHPTKLIIKYDAFCKHSSPLSSSVHRRPSCCYPHCVAAFFAAEMLHLQRINSWIRPLSVFAVSVMMIITEAADSQ